MADLHMKETHNPLVRSLMAILLDMESRNGGPVRADITAEQRVAAIKRARPLMEEYLRIHAPDEEHLWIFGDAHAVPVAGYALYMYSKYVENNSATDRRLNS